MMQANTTVRKQPLNCPTQRWPINAEKAAAIRVRIKKCGGTPGTATFFIVRLHAPNRTLIRDNYCETFLLSPGQIREVHEIRQGEVYSGYKHKFFCKES